MSKFGFVYILVNEYMPDVYKVGCTERSPHERAAELSNHTGVPFPFRVLCYIEVPDFQAVEKRLHGWLSRRRIRSDREFFSGGLESAVRYLFWYPQRMSFVAPSESGQRDGLEDELDFSRWGGLQSELADPWLPKDPPSQAGSVDPAVAKVVDAAIARIETGEQPKSEDGEPF